MAFHENTPEPDTGDVTGDDTPLHVGGRHTPPPLQLTSQINRGARNDPRMYELALQRERMLRSSAIPIPSQAWSPLPPPTAARGSGANLAQAEFAVHGATDVLNRQLRESGGDRRGPEPGSRNIADVLPIVESAGSSHHQSVFVQPGQFYHPQASTRRHQVTQSIRTPDLDYAEIGHGRGTHGNGMTGSQDWASRQPMMDVDAPGPSSGARSPNNRSLSDPGNLSNFLFNHSGYPAQGSPPDVITQSQPPIGTRPRDARGTRRRDQPPPNADPSRGGRTFLRSRIRTGLNIAENYASSFTFLSGRFPPPPGGRDGGDGSPHRPQHHT